ncbi:MAG: helix-turn-helix transcriptional regulator [Chloroflexi bacterium]|nr:helix-turn-helix transcriptional regulator [Chloroflexota bacterium]
MNQLPKLLEERGWTSYRLSRQSGLFANSVKKLVDSAKIPDGTEYKTLRSIAEALGVTIDDLEKAN